LNRETIDPAWLFKVRVAVARHGEMDRAKWWNTNKALGSVGALALRRGLPRTHSFAQARIVFTVARHRCDEVFNPPESATLWRLPEQIEESIEAAWEGWLDDVSSWSDFFNEISNPAEAELGALLRRLGLVAESDVSAVSSLRRSSDGRAIALPRVFGGTQDEIAQLALGFVKGAVGDLVVPYARLA
jgi:hypothetical protein